MSRSQLIGLFVVALTIRLAYGLQPVPPTADAADYLRLARSVADGEGFLDENGQPTAFRPPLYPMFLAPMSHSVVAATVAQSLLGSISCLMLVGLCVRWMGSATESIVAGLLMAVDPIQAAACGVVLSEVLYEFLLLGTLLILPTGDHPSRLLCAGAAGDLCLLTRSAGLPFLAAVVIYLWLVRPRDLRAAGLFALGVGIVLSPWLARNAVTMGAPVLTTQSGVALYSSYVPPNGGIFGVLVSDEVVREAQRGGEVAADRTLTRAAVALALSRPAETLRLSILKAAFFLVPVDWEIAVPSGRIAPVYLLALPFALFACLRRRKALLLPMLVLAAVLGFSIVVYGSPRLRFPYEPLIIAIAAGPIVESMQQPALWLWGSLCSLLWLAGETPKYWLRSAAQVLGLW